MSDDLKSCPFCGGKAEFTSRYDSDDNRPDGYQYFVVCLQCDARGPEYYAVSINETRLTKDKIKFQSDNTCKAIEMATRAWNTRI